MTYLVREVEVSDAATVTQLSFQLGYSPTTDETKAYIQKIRQRKDEIVFVVADEGTVIAWAHAFITNRLESGAFAEIGGMVVDESYRGKGIGKLLIGHITSWVQAKGVQRLRVRSNVKREATHKFYKGSGFEEIKEQKVFEITITK